MNKTYLGAVGLLLAAIVLNISCKKDSGPAATNDPCPWDPLHPYGTGSASATVSGAGGLFSVTGPYKPSADFGNDSVSSQGAGGFLHDTVIAHDTITARFAAYTHVVRHDTLYESILVITLTDSAGKIGTGTYRIVKQGAPGGGRSSTITYILNDLTHFYSFFASDSGSLTITGLDTCAHHVDATFSGKLYDTSSPSATYLIQNGSFAITYVGRYYAW